MEIAIYLVINFVLSCIIGAVASGKNRSGVGYFFISAIFSPLIAIIILAVAGDNNAN